MLTLSGLADRPHLRFNLLRNEWVQVSAARNARPWQGEIEPAAPTALPQHDPACYLCPRSRRARGAANPDYTSTFVFDNDFPALVPSEPAAVDASCEDHLLIARPEAGICRVVCFSPRHDLALSRMNPESIRAVVDAWVDELTRLGSIPSIRYVLIFENRGAAMGASNPHPHGQIWATATIPNEPRRELDAMAEWRTKRRTCLLCEYARVEGDRGERHVLANDAFRAIVPFWAVWPFETLVLPRRHVRGLDELNSHERDALADVLKRLTARYDNLFGTPFPYSMGFHQRPTDGNAHDECHLHAHFYPPLLRSATVRKFMVGFELLGSPQRDLTPEDAAARLRSASEEI